MILGNENLAICKHNHSTSSDFRFSFHFHLQSQTRSFYVGDNQNSFSVQNNTKFTLEELEDSPSQSKEAWAADYVKSELQELSVSEETIPTEHFSLAVLLGSTAANERKRKSDWMQQHVELGNHLSENGPTAKIAAKERVRSKSQGECLCHARRKIILSK